MTYRNKSAVSSSLFRKPAIAGQGCTYCADASEPGEESIQEPAAPFFRHSVLTGTGAGLPMQ